MSVDQTLAARAARYGSYPETCRITQEIVTSLNSGCNAAFLSDTQRVSLFMIASKLARIVNGDPNYPDSWHDIGGYAKLVENHLGEGSCLADTTQPMSSGTKKPPLKSKSERSETRPDTTSSEPEKSIREMGSMSITAAHWPKEGPTPLLTGGFDQGTLTVQRAI